MTTDRKPTVAKRQRELEQQDSAARAARLAERKTRLAERVAAGASGGPVEVDVPDRRPTPDAPFLDEL